MIVLLVVLVILFIYLCPVNSTEGFESKLSNTKPDLKLKSNTIDSSIFDISTNTPTIVYGTDLRDNSFSNQNLRALVHDILDSKYLYGSTGIDIDTKIYINWIFNHSRFTNNRNKRYKMYNQKKYFSIPLESYEYSAPLLDESCAQGSIIPVGKSDIIDLDHQDVFKTTRTLCNSKIFIAEPRKEDKIVLRMYMIVVTDPIPRFVYTSVPSISTPIKDRIHYKMNELGKLIALEHSQESTIDQFQNTIRAHNITLYQIFGIDVVVRNNEPYVSNIHTNVEFIDSKTDFIQKARKILDLD